MVATTPTYDLPYQEATDAPCDAPEVWCELATLVNVAMGATKSTLDRVEPAVPAALVSRLDTTLIIPPITPVMIPFDTVWLDTDGMVNEDVSNVFVFPRRLGLYRTVVNMEYLNIDVTTNFYVGITAATSYFGFPGPFGTGIQVGAAATDSVGVFAPANNNHLRTVATVNVTQAFLDQSAANAGGIGIAIAAPVSGTLRVLRAQLGVYYLREAP